MSAVSGGAQNHYTSGLVARCLEGAPSPFEQHVLSLRQILSQRRAQLIAGLLSSPLPAGVLIYGVQQTGRGEWVEQWDCVGGYFVTIVFDDVSKENSLISKMRANGLDTHVGARFCGLMPNRSTGFIRLSFSHFDANVLLTAGLKISELMQEL